MLWESGAGWNLRVHESNSLGVEAVGKLGCTGATAVEPDGRGSNSVCVTSRSPLQWQRRYTDIVYGRMG